ncbi:MAG: MerR family transcriptional regulator [Actinobacteria bacterium]|nr:MerR family transcriptional regulator [Actinomycetota bacterium]
MTDTFSHSSIGEVLALLQSDYPDITISKIRFLESQGLLNPERTPSGYRKFHDEDIERLRWILTQQREHFLPLKVIKDRLAAGDFADGPPEGVLPFERSSENAVNSNGSATSENLENSAAKDGGSTSRTSAVTRLLEGPAATAPEPRGGKRHPTGHKKGDPTPVKGAEEEIEVPEVALTLKELCEQSGLGQSEVAELEKFGLLTRRSMGHVEYYDEEALVVARLAGGFGRHGIEPRHLRMYKVSADREAGLFEQLITPLLKQRRAAAREEAVEMLEELAELADDLRAVMVRASLREYLGQP